MNSIFGAENALLSQIRRSILHNKTHQSKELLNTHGPTLRILVLDEDLPQGLEVRNYLTEKISNIEVHNYGHYGQFLSDLADKETTNRKELPVHFDLIIANYEVFEIEKKKRWEQICQYLQDRATKHGKPINQLPELLLISRKKIQLEDMRDLGLWVRDVFFAPLDKGYFLKKLLLQYPTLLNKEAMTVTDIIDNSILKSRTPSRSHKSQRPVWF